jgi:hypothetical protein
MSEEQVHVVIEGEEPEHSTRRPAPTVPSDAGARLEAARWQRAAQIGDAEKAVLAAKNDADAAQHDYALAAETGDFAKQADASRRMSAAESRMSEAEGRVADLRQAPVSSGDVVEDMAAGMSAASAAWLRAHRDLAADPHGMSKIRGAHFMAVGEGVQVDSPEYFRRVEQLVGARGAGHGNGSSRNGGGGNTVTLSKGEVERANDGSIVWNTGPNKGRPIGNVEYARRKAAMTAEGRYSKLG